MVPNTHKLLLHTRQGFLINSAAWKNTFRSLAFIIAYQFSLRWVNFIDVSTSSFYETGHIYTLVGSRWSWGKEVFSHIDNFSHNGEIYALQLKWMMGWDGWRGKSLIPVFIPFLLSIYTNITTACLTCVCEREKHSTVSKMLNLFKILSVQYTIRHPISSLKT